MAGVLGLGDPVAKPALQRHCHAKPWLGAAPSGPQLRPQSPVLGAREGHPPAGSTGPGARRCLESGLSGPQSPVRGGGCPQGRKGGAQVRSDRGHRTHPAHGLEEVSGVPPGAEAAETGCRSLRPTLCLLHCTNGPPLPGSINTPAPTTPHAAGHGQAPLEANRNHGFGGAGSPSQPSPPPHQHPECRKGFRGQQTRAGQHRQKVELKSRQKTSFLPSFLPSILHSLSTLRQGVCVLRKDLLAGPHREQW